ncbi:hypothetical protein GVAV_002346 [Gurleya vavrai]
MNKCLKKFKHKLSKSSIEFMNIDTFKPKKEIERSKITVPLFNKNFYSGKDFSDKMDLENDNKKDENLKFNKDRKNLESGEKQKRVTFAKNIEEVKIIDTKNNKIENSNKKENNNKSENIIKRENNSKIENSNKREKSYKKEKSNKSEKSNKKENSNKIEKSNKKENINKSENITNFENINLKSENNNIAENFSKRKNNYKVENIIENNKKRESIKVFDYVTKKRKYTKNEQQNEEAFKKSGNNNFFDENIKMHKKNINAKDKSNFQEKTFLKSDKNKISNKKEFNNSKKSKENICQKNELTSIEQELLKNGTKKDQINMLTLLIDKNPNNCNEELSKLIEKCYDERAETVFYILKNIKDLLLSNLKFNDDNIFFKKKIIVLFEQNLRNTHIKQKIVDLIFLILKKDVLFIDFIYMFINKLGDKKEISKKVFNHIKTLYEKDINREIIIFGLEEFYTKDHKSRKTVTSLFNKLKVFGIKNTDLYYTFFENLKGKDFSDKSDYEKTLNNIINGLLSQEIDTERHFDVNTLLNVFNSFQLNFNILKFLFKIKNNFLNSHLVRILRSLQKIEIKYRDDFFNFIFTYLSNEKDHNKIILCIETLLSTLYFHDIEFTISSLIVVNKLLVIDFDSFTSLYVLNIFLNHYHPVVRYCADKIIKKEEISNFNPNDYNEIERIILLTKN